MSRSRGQHKRSWLMPNRHVKDLTKKKSRALERGAIAKFLKDEKDVVLSRYKDCVDFWYYD